MGWGEGRGGEGGGGRGGADGGSTSRRACLLGSDIILCCAQDLWEGGFQGRAVTLRVHAACHLSRELCCDIYVCDYGQRTYKAVELDTAFGSEGCLAGICSCSILQKVDRHRRWHRSRRGLGKAVQLSAWPCRSGDIDISHRR